MGHRNGNRNHQQLRPGKGVKLLRENTGQEEMSSRSRIKSRRIPSQEVKEENPEKKCERVVRKDGNIMRERELCWKLLSLQEERQQL